MDEPAVQAFVDTLATAGLVIWVLEANVLRTKFANGIARNAFGLALEHPPRVDIDRILDQVLRAAMVSPGLEHRLEIKELTHATSGERFNALARVVGLSSSMVCAHLYTTDFPFPVVGCAYRETIESAPAVVDSFISGRPSRDVVSQRDAELIGAGFGLSFELCSSSLGMSLDFC